MWTPEQVKVRLEEAADVLRRLRMDGGPKEYGSLWPAILHEIVEAYGYSQVVAGDDPPQGGEIDRMEEALIWLGYLQHRDRRLVWGRINGVPWWQFAQRHRRSERTVQRWFDDALRRIADGLNKPRRKKVVAHARQT